MACGKVYMTHVLYSAPEHLFIENTFYTELTSQIQSVLAFLVFLIYLMIKYKPKVRVKKMKEATLIEIDNALGLKHH